jgi:hypothetical protein
LDMVEQIKLKLKKWVKKNIYHSKLKI